MSPLGSALAFQHSPTARFVALPTPKLTEKLDTQIKDKENEVEKLGQKLHYLETTFKNSRQAIDQMLKSQGA